MSYGTPPFPEWPSGPSAETPDNTLKSSKLQNFPEDSGTFQISLNQPVEIQRGTTMRFTFQAAHVKDGAIGTSTQPFTTPLALAILDRNRQAVLSAMFTVGPVTNYPAGSNQFYVDVTATSVCDLQFFEAKWTATYTPIGTLTALPIQSVRGFKVFQPAGPGRHYFFATNQFGAR